MRHILYLLFFLFYFNLYSQEDIGVVMYGHKKSVGMGAPIGIDFNAFLAFNKEGSIYTFAKDSLEGGHINEDTVIEKNGSDEIFVVSKISNPTGFKYYLDNKKKKFLSRDIGFNYVEENIPTIKWEISEEKKNIGNLECLKATAEFRGRKYTAWFTTSIPLPYGPWKLQGLPGLIVEAYDENKEVYFYFKSIEYPVKDSKIKIDKPDPKEDGKKWITFEEYKQKLIKAHKSAIQNGRMLMEGVDSATESEEENTMGKYYIEIFEEN